MIDKPTLLLVEDTLTQALRLTRILSEKFEVRQAASGGEALVILQSFVPALVLTDINMPEVSGIDLCARIKADSALAAVPVALLIFPQDATASKAILESSADDLVGKIFDGQYLLPAVSGVIERAGGGSGSDIELARYRNMLISALEIITYHDRKKET